MTYGAQSEKLELLYAHREELKAESAALFKSITKTLVDRWLAAGGCTSCLGHERVVTWSTLDGPGWTEYGTCTACTPVSKSAGQKPGSFWAGGWSAALSGDINLNQLFNLPEFHTQAILLNTYQLHLEATALAIKEEEDRLTVGRGKMVVVVKGRKIQKGVTGECFWVGPDRFGGERVGFTTPAGETLWTNKANVAVATEGN